jgi:hypothetical protein
VDASNLSTRKTAPNRAEYDFTAEYRPPWRWPAFLQRLWFRARAAVVDQEDAKRTGYQVRLILHWDRDLL